MAKKGWIAEATKNRGGLTRAFPRIAKGGFSTEELNRIMKNSKSTHAKRQASLAKTLKSFH
jgi:hypothetical protein